jgi:pimeloyl-ACP methyl ester carboxylesterase
LVVSGQDSIQGTSMTSIAHFLHSDAVSSFVMLSIFISLMAAQISSRKWVRRVALVLFILMTYMVINAYRSLIKGLTRPTYDSRKEEVIQGKYHLTHDLHAQQVSLYTEDGLQLSGYLILRPQAKGTIMLFHGWRSTKDLLTCYVDALPDYNFFLFDFRAHGESEGNLMTLGIKEIHDSRAALDFVTSYEKTKHLPLYGLGISMGGAHLIALAHERPQAFKALVIDSSFASLRQSAISDFKLRSWLPTVPFFSMFRWIMWVLTRNDFSYEPVQFARDMKVPILVIHSAQDTRINSAQALQLYEASRQANPNSEIWHFQNGKHGALCAQDPKAYGEKVRGFFGKVST